MPHDAGAGAAQLTSGQRLALLSGDIRAARRRYRTRWLELERQYPVLVAYRAGQGADSAALAQLGSASTGEGALRAVLTTALPKLGNIHKTRLWLRMGRLSPLALPPVVELTRQRLGVAPGSLQAHVVRDAEDEASSGGWTDWAVAAVTLGLAVLSAVPSGGSSLELGASLAGLALDTYAAIDTLDQFHLHAAASDTALDRARALSHEEPSLTWLAVTLVSLPLDAAFVARTFCKAARLRRAAAAGTASDDTIRELNALGQEHDLGPLGTRVADPALGSAGTAQAIGRPPNRIGSARELMRRAAEPGPFHNFPESFDEQIFEQGTRTVIPDFWRKARPGLSNDAIMYRLGGTVNGVDGTFEIGIRPSLSGNTEIIVHRFFRPNP